MLSAASLMPSMETPDFVINALDRNACNEYVFP
jgi:hypothetical protein